jgi:hypothetical protein
MLHHVDQRSYTSGVFTFMTSGNKAATFLIGVALLACFTQPASAGIISTIAEYNGPFYDLVTTFPPPSTTIGAFTFTIPSGTKIWGATISGTFGNDDVFSNTALSDYYVDVGGIKVAGCDDPSANCFSGQDGVPTPWSYTFSNADLANLASSLAGGSLDFTVVQTSPGSVQTGVTTLNLVTTPEPATFFALGGGLAVIALLRRLNRL